jgi:hypothetical protein
MKRSQPRKRQTLEFDSQVSLFKWARNPAVLAKHPCLDLLSCSLNGVRLSKAQAGKAKASGMLAGEFDIKLPVARGEFIGLIIEMKAGKNTLTKEQKWYGTRMADEGHCVLTFWDWEKAKNSIIDYLNLDDVT